MLASGRYELRAGWEPRRARDHFLARSRIEVDGDGVVIVFADDEEPLLAYASAGDFFCAFDLAATDLVRKP